MVSYLFAAMFNVELWLFILYLVFFILNWFYESTPLKQINFSEEGRDDGVN
jgi:hypothetical protein